MSDQRTHTPLVTFIVAVFNGRSTLQRRIDSVAHQTWASRELIVIDGGSTDGSERSLRRTGAPSARELKAGKPRYLPQIVVADMQYGGISNRRENTLISLREMQAARVKHGLPVFNPYFVAGLARVCIRLLLWRVLGEKSARRAMDWGRRLAGKAAYWART